MFWPSLSDINSLLKSMEKRMDARIQKVLDDIAALKPVADAVVADLADLKKQIADLQAQVAAGSPVTEADLQALADAATSLETSTGELSGAIPPAPGPAV